VFGHFITNGFSYFFACGSGRWQGEANHEPDTCSLYHLCGLPAMPSEKCGWRSPQAARYSDDADQGRISLPPLDFSEVRGMQPRQFR
jgi:hypothetical protein